MLITASPLIEYDEENDKIRAMPEFNKQNGNKASNVSFTFSIYEKKRYQSLVLQVLLNLLYTNNQPKK